MKAIIIALFVCSHLCNAQQSSKQSGDKQTHYVCNLSKETYHNLVGCSDLQMCRGGRYRKVVDIGTLKPCKKCVKSFGPEITRSTSSAPGFSDIKRVLGVRDKKQIADSLGTAQGTIARPNGVTLRISGPPESKTVNSIEFFFLNPVVFDADTLLSQKFYQKLGLQFQKCRADTVRNNTPHPVTGKVKNDFIIEYRGCAIVEPRDAYEDVSKYYYELLFVSREVDSRTYVEKIQLLLKVDQ